MKIAVVSFCPIQNEALRKFSVFFIFLNLCDFFQNCAKIVYNAKAHVCAKFGNDVINLAMVMALTLVIWLESHESSYMTVHFGLCRS